MITTYMHNVIYTDVLSIEDILGIDNLFYESLSNKRFKHQYL